MTISVYETITVTDRVTEVTVHTIWRDRTGLSNPTWGDRSALTKTWTDRTAVTNSWTDQDRPIV